MNDKSQQCYSWKVSPEFQRHYPGLWQYDAGMIRLQHRLL